LLQLNNEIIEKIDIHIGYLHRGVEKLIETKNYIQNIPYFDRFDYMTMFVHEHLYCLTVESCLNIFNFNSNLIFFRTLFDEISRILNHVIAIACHALDIGSMTPIF
jgi:NADH dehydrogenase (ubiquinone) Fe-S protein 2